MFTAFAFCLYWTLAVIFPAQVIRDIANAFTLSIAFIIVATWATSTIRAIREGASNGAWQLIMGITLVWFVILAQRLYAIAFNWFGRPMSWLDSPITGFWPYSFFIAGILFLSAPGLQVDGKLKRRAIASMLIAVGLGCFIAGTLFGASISSD